MIRSLLLAVVFSAVALGQNFMWPGGYMDPSQCQLPSTPAVIPFTAKLGDSCDITGAPMVPQAGYHAMLNLTLEIDLSTLPPGYDPTYGYSYVYMWFSPTWNPSMTEFGMLNTSGFSVLWMVPTAVTYMNFPVQTWQTDPQRSNLVNLDSTCLAVMSNQAIFPPISCIAQAVVAVPTLWNTFVATATYPLTVYIQ